MFIVYTRMEDGSVWYYGKYQSRDRANEVVQMLGSEFHGVCTVEDAKEYGVNNLPLGL